jgi:hypothetical protein
MPPEEAVGSVLVVPLTDVVVVLLCAVVEVVVGPLTFAVVLQAAAMIARQAHRPKTLSRLNWWVSSVLGI